MNEVAYVSEQASRRVNLRDLADMPCDMVAVFDALDDLNPWQFKAWFRLRVHLYRRGEFADRHEGAGADCPYRRGGLRADGRRDRAALRSRRGRALDRRPPNSRQGQPHRSASGRDAGGRPGAQRETLACGRQGREDDPVEAARRRRSSGARVHLRQSSKTRRHGKQNAGRRSLFCFLRAAGGSSKRLAQARVCLFVCLSLKANFQTKTVAKLTDRPASSRARRKQAMKQNQFPPMKQTIDQKSSMDRSYEPSSRPIL